MENRAELNQKNSVEYWVENRAALQKAYEEKEETYNSLILLLVSRAEEIMDSSAHRAMVSGRVKKFDTFYKKILDKSRTAVIKNPFEEIHDILGVRIVVPFIEDIRTAETRIRDAFDVSETKYKKQNLSLQEFGYDSTHLIVTVPEKFKTAACTKEDIHCEIQIRTILQDAWAEVEHELIYKSSLGTIEPGIRRKLTALNATLSLADISFQEIRDYQNRQAREIEDRRERILNNASALPWEIAEKNRPAETPSDTRSSLSVQELPAEPTDEQINNIFYEALKAHSRGNMKEAEELYSYILKIFPSRYVYNHRGLVYFSMSSYRKAADDFTSALEAGPDDARVWANRGFAFRMLGEMDRAMDDFTKAAELNPLWPDTFYGMALTLYDAGDIKASLENCDRAISLRPDFRQAVKFKQFILGLDMPFINM